MKGLRVAIVGGGIGGLTAALALTRSGHHPTVYERAEVLRPVGAGISLWSNGIKVLSLLGLGPEVAALGGHMDTMAYATAGGEELTAFSLSPLYDRVGQRAWPVARAALQDLLLAAVGPSQVHLGATCVGIDDGDETARVRFADGTVVEADVVVAADGTHSSLRAHVLGAPVERRYVGYLNCNGLVPTDPATAPPTQWRTWVGDGKRVSVMPVGGDQRYTFFDVPMPRHRAVEVGDPAPLLRREFGGWCAPVRRLLDHVAATTLNAVAIHDLEPLPTWRRGRVALLGDAAHTMAPDLGQGGCQAMEDSLVLAHHLTTTDVSVPDALARYEAERLPHTAGMVRRARRRADTTHGVDPAATEAWYAELAGEDGAAIIDGLAQSVLTGPCR